MPHSISKPTLAPFFRNSPRTLVFRTISVVLLFAAALLVPAQSAAPHPAKPHHGAVHARGQAEHPAATPPQPAEPPTPQAPQWPVNDAPTQPSVTWDSQGLHIAATNASLSRILAEVSTETGAKIEGLAGDERVFGNYGPGNANDVLSQLLHGSSYDFLLLGDQGQGTPREVILSPRNSAAGAPGSPDINRPNPEPAQDDDNGQESDEGQPFQPPQPIQAPQRPNMGQPFNPRAPMTPQERMQQMQQMRQQQLQQQQQQQNQQQPQ
ncbi:MAG TPA: hypothetical protein VG225_17620 [Terracidiphilus sp.]|jgi:hypothetical protein|nr:hypothetical protein [Terracidiphilus sp.]